LSASVDLKNPHGYEFARNLRSKMYSGVKQYLPEGAKVPHAAFFDSGAGARSIRMGFDASNAEAGNALQAELREWVTGWGIQRGLLDKSGDPVPGAGRMPVAEDHPFLSAENFEGGGQKILNPRFAAEMRRLVTQAGGTFDLDKDSGITEWLVPEGAVTGEGKSLVKKPAFKACGVKQRLEERKCFVVFASGRRKSGDC
jgi:hypothetical protein